MTDFEVDRYVKLAGTNHDPRRKLSVQDVQHMKQEYRKGKSINSIAKKYGVHYGTVQYHVVPNYKHEHNQYRKNFKMSDLDQIECRKKRVALKRSILDGSIKC